MIYPTMQMPYLQPTYVPSYPAPSYYTMPQMQPVQPVQPVLTPQMQPMVMPQMPQPTVFVQPNRPTQVVTMNEYSENIAPKPKAKAIPLAVPASNPKKGQKEYAASINDFRFMLATVLRGGKDSGSDAVAARCGFPSESRSLRRYAAEIRNDERLRRASAAETLQARLVAAAQVEYKPKTPPNFEARRLFSDDDLLFFERTLIKYGEMGWPMEYRAIQRLFSTTAKEMGRVDWKSGDAYVVSETYVRAFVKRRPTLRALKTTNIDPLRSKKASVTVGPCRGARRTCCTFVSRTCYLCCVGLCMRSVCPERCPVSSRAVALLLTPPSHRDPRRVLLRSVTIFST